MKTSIQHIFHGVLASTMICLAGCGGSGNPSASNTGSTGTTTGTVSGTTTPPTTPPTAPPTTPPTTPPSTPISPAPPAPTGPPPPASPYMPGPAGSPSITTQPAPQTVVAGQQPFFSVVATGASSYQWSVNGTAITGATSATYQAPITAANDAGGEEYTVAVSNSSGTSISQSAAVSINQSADGSPPASFWGNPATLPVATQSMMLSFVNQTNGKYPDSQVFWSIQGTTGAGVKVNELHSIADQATYDLPQVQSARMYFYIAPSAAAIAQSNTSYFDFIEFNIGVNHNVYNFNGDTTRVDAFGLKTAIKLQCADGANGGSGANLARGEDYGTFLEDRAITFQKYLAETTPEFVVSGTQYAPYRITDPGASGFGPGGAQATYYNAYIDLVWANNGIDTTVVPKPTPFLNFTSNQMTDLSAALERHVAGKAGTFNSQGKLVDPNFWSKTPASTFYSAAPTDYYAKFWHTHAIGGYAYGFPYDDVGGHSSDFGCTSPTYLVVAIGW